MLDLFSLLSPLITASLPPTIITSSDTPDTVPTAETISQFATAETTHPPDPNPPVLQRAVSVLRSHRVHPQQLEAAAHGALRQRIELPDHAWAHH
jgi:hypothetical protein